MSEFEIILLENINSLIKFKKINKYLILSISNLNFTNDMIISKEVELILNELHILSRNIKFAQVNNPAVQFFKDCECNIIINPKIDQLIIRINSSFNYFEFKFKTDNFKDDLTTLALNIERFINYIANKEG